MLKNFVWIVLIIISLAVAAVFVRTYTARPDNRFQAIDWNTLSNFKYDTYEVLNEVDGGRPFTRSDDSIPGHVKALHGRRVAVTGFIMPLRLKKGMVTEFLLFKDQAACCFGPAAKMNHYIRVKVNDGGFPPSGSLVPYTAYGLLHVGEIHVQGYLTGIYELEAEKVEQKG
jgi:hypothetical protein